MSAVEQTTGTPGSHTQRPQSEGRGRTVLRPGWRLLLISPKGVWWGPWVYSTTRRSAVDRRTATMMYANRDRRTAIRS